MDACFRSFSRSVWSQLLPPSHCSTHSAVCCTPIGGTACNRRSPRAAAAGRLITARRRQATRSVSRPRPSTFARSPWRRRTTWRSWLFSWHSRLRMLVQLHARRRAQVPSVRSLRLIRAALAAQPTPDSSALYAPTTVRSPRGAQTRVVHRLRTAIRLDLGRHLARSSRLRVLSRLETKREAVIDLASTGLCWSPPPLTSPHLQRDSTTG